MTNMISPFDTLIKDMREQNQGKFMVSSGLVVTTKLGEMESNTRELGSSSMSKKGMGCFHDVVMKKKFKVSIQIWED